MTRSGAAIETAGAWEVRGPLIVFTTADGQLSSLRARDVDLDASRARTAAPPAAEPEPPPPPPRRGPVWVITDADVGHVDREIGDGDEPAGDPAPSGPSPGEPAVSVIEIVGWRDRVDVQANTLEVFGTAANRGSSLATDLRLEVRLLDPDGALLRSRQASLGARVLAPGDVVSFSANFPGSPGFAAVEFDVKSRGFRLRPDPEPDAEL